MLNLYDHKEYSHIAHECIEQPGLPGGDPGSGTIMRLDHGLRVRGSSWALVGTHVPALRLGKKVGAWTLDDVGTES